MNDAALPPTDDHAPLSPWWIRTILIVLVFGMVVLIAITVQGYKKAPPVPGRVVDAQGQVLFTGDDIRAGQAVFLKYGLMDNGSVWGHGAYLGPDYSAEALHELGLDTAEALAQAQYGKALAELDPGQRAEVEAGTAVSLKTNRYDASADTLTLTAAEAAAWQKQIAHWTDYFRHPERNGGLKPDLITDTAELRQFTAFVA